MRIYRATYRNRDTSALPMRALEASVRLAYRVAERYARGKMGGEG